MTPKETGIFGRNDKLPARSPRIPPHRCPAPEPVDRQDYLIAALKKRGIYVNMNLHVGALSERAQLHRPAHDRLRKGIRRALLTRVNPYTGLSYAADPCVAVEINNENG